LITLLILPAFVNFPIESLREFDTFILFFAPFTIKLFIPLLVFPLSSSDPYLNLEIYYAKEFGFLFSGGAVLLGCFFYK